MNREETEDRRSIPDPESQIPAAKLISIVTPCYNEEGNVRTVYERVRAVFESLDGYAYEHIFADNASSDNTVAILKEIAKDDKRVRIIVNTRNFGPNRSGSHALLQSRGEAVVALVADLQDPPEIIPQFLKKWEEGYKIVLGIKEQSKESRLMFAVRKFYYNLLESISSIKLVKNTTGFGVYDRDVVEMFRSVHDPDPYFRGLICDFGYERAEIAYTQAARERGVTSYNFYRLYDYAMLGFTSHSKVPLRLAAFAGFGIAFLSLLVAVAYFIYKLVFWDSFQVGMAPLVIGIFFFSAVQLIFTGILGEYIGAIHTQVLKRPLVVEKERINFDR